MRIGVVSALCDAVELASLALNKDLTAKDLTQELGEGLPEKEVSAYLEDALGAAQQRAKACGKGYYPFSVTSRLISITTPLKFDPYVFLLLGSSLKIGGVSDAERLARLFRRHFEDLVCWCLRRAGFSAEILSIPRGERGLPISLKPALREIASRFGEPALLIEEKVTSDDNDLGVDVVATWSQIDYGRSGRPIVLIQCATGPVTELSSKLGEKASVFPKVWQLGFYQDSSIRTAATPDDLTGLEKVHWDRLSEQGWILDRLRLVQLAAARKENPPVPPCLLALWDELSACVSKMDWRNGWRGQL
ncbi:hypothetical protein OpiT1DRAFT_03443 [Opitutaceae bacterium TAV1]|nr:hypothetical protein OpiT1DRAFT_03443 [Opitutaceae bacterium TAV1]